MAKVKSDEFLFFDILFERDLDIKNRIIYLNTEVGDYSQDLIQKGLNIFDAEPNKPVTIEVNSYGGCVYSMLGIVDRIKASPCHITTKTIGKSMSSATFIFSAGDDRLIGRNSWMMVHEMWVMEEGKMSEVRNVMKHNEALEKQMYNLYKEFTGVTAARWEKWCEKDYYISSSEALKYKLATGLMEYDGVKT